MKENKKNFVIITFVSEIIVKLGNFIIFPLLVKFLGQEGYGVNVQIMAISGLLVPVAMLGLPFNVVRQISGVTDKNLISRHLLSNLLLVGVASGILAGVIYGFAPLINAYFIKVDWANSTIQLSSMLIIVSAIDGLLISYYRAFLKIFAMSIFDIMKTFLSVAAVMYVLQTGKGLFVIILVMLLVQSIGIVGKLALLIIKKYLIIQFKILPLSELKKMLKFGLPAIVAGMGALLLSSADRILIGYFTNAGNAGLYTAAYTLSGLITMFGSPFFTPMYPDMARYKNANDVHSLSKTCRGYISGFFVIAMPAVLGMTILSQDILLIFGNEEFMISRIIFLIIIMGLFSDLVTVPARYLVYLQNEPALLQKIILSVSAFNIAMNLILIPIFGIGGAAIASFAAYLIMSFLLLKRMKSYGYVIHDFYNFITMLKIIIVSVIMSVMLEMFRKSMGSGEGLLFLLYQVSIGLFIYIILLSLIFKFDYKKIFN